jgi:hypothetical protein
MSNAIALSLVKLITERTFFPLTSPTQLKFPFQISPIIWSYTVIEVDPTGKQHDPNYKWAKAKADLWAISW